MPEGKYVPEAGSLFLDQPEFGGAYGLSIAVDRVLFDVQSEFQHIQVIEAGRIGRLLVLDNVIQTCQLDETAYHEMLVHVPLLSHPRPENVLVIGGGDGGTLREVGKHPTVRRMDICEIDGQVIEASRRFLPGLACSFDDPRVRVHLDDGAKFAARAEGQYDVIIVDSSDPVGPARVLYKSPFYRDMKKALRPGGVIVTQAESFYLFEDLIRDLFAFITDLFDQAYYYNTLVPTYITGVIGFAFCSLGPDPLQGPDPARAAALGPLKYYNPSLHRGAFCLPQRCLDLLPPRVAQAQSAVWDRT